MKFIFNWVLLFLGVLTFSQSYEIRGKIIDSHDKVPLSNATVTASNRSAFTDANGNFILSKIPKGSHTITVSHPLCDTQQQTIQVDEDLYITLYLEHHAQDIEQLNITAVHEPKNSFSVTTLDKATLERKSADNLGNAMSGIAGVTTLKTGNNVSKPVIHGLLGSRISIINNSVKMAEQEWGAEHAPSIDAGAFDHVDVIKGAGTLQYGASAGGIVVLEPRIFPARDSLEGRLILNGISNGKGGSAVAEVAKYWENRWFVKTQGSYKKLGDLSTPDFTLQNTGAEEQAVSFAAGFRKFNAALEFYYNGVQQNFGIFTGSHLGNSEDFFNAVNGNQALYTGDFSYLINNPRQEVGHHVFKLEGYRRFSSFGKFTGTYSLQMNDRKEYDIRRGELNTLASMDLRLTTHQVKFQHLLEREKWQVESGMAGTFQNNYPDPATKTRRLIPDYNRYEGGIFSVFTFKPSPKFTWEAGLRLDADYYDAYKYYDEETWDANFAQEFPEFFVQKNGVRVLTRPQLNFTNLSGNVGVDYQPASHFNLKVNLARASRSPNAAELFADGLHHSASIIERGNLAIRTENIHQLNASLRYKNDWLEGLHLELTPYLMFSENFINQVPSGFQNTIRGNFVVWDFQQIKAQMLGIDAVSELQLTPKFKWKSNFSAIKGDDLTHSEPLILMPPVSFGNMMQYENKDYRNLFVEIGHRSSLQQKRFPVRDVSVEIIENGAAVTKTLDLSTPPAGYTLWDLSAGVEVTENLKMNGQVSNLFNSRYREYMNRLRYFSDAMGRNAVLSLIYNF